MYWNWKGFFREVAPVEISITIFLFTSGPNETFWTDLVEFKGFRYIVVKEGICWSLYSQVWEHFEYTCEGGGGGGLSRANGTVSWMSELGEAAHFSGPLLYLHRSIWKCPSHRSSVFTGSVRDPRSGQMDGRIDSVSSPWPSVVVWVGYVFHMSMCTMCYMVAMVQRSALNCVQ